MSRRRPPERYIVEVRDAIPVASAFEYCRAVAWGGRVSGNGKQHCYYSVFRDGTAVSCIKRGKSERFIVSRNGVVP